MAEIVISNFWFEIVAKEEKAIVNVKTSVPNQIIPVTFDLSSPVGRNIFRDVRHMLEKYNGIETLHFETTKEVFYTSYI